MKPVYACDKWPRVSYEHSILFCMSNESLLVAKQSSLNNEKEDSNSFLLVHAVSEAMHPKVMKNEICDIYIVRVTTSLRQWHGGYCNDFPCRRTRVRIPLGIFFFFSPPPFLPSSLFLLIFSFFPQLLQCLSIFLSFSCLLLAYTKMICDCSSTLIHNHVIIH